MSAAREQIVATQEQRLRSMIATVVESNPFYRRKLTPFLGPAEAAQLDLDGLAQLPLTTKEELVLDQQAHPPYGSNLSFPLRDYIRLHRTSGSSGRALHWLDTRESWRWWIECWKHIFAAAGVGPDDRVFVAFSFGPFIGFWTAFEAAQELGALTLTGAALTTTQRLETMVEHQATVLVSTPTYALRMAEEARRQGLNADQLPLRVGIHAGEPGASVPNVRRRLEDAWGYHCIDHAGATEVGAWGASSLDDDLMTLLETEFIAEVIDPQSGEAAATSADGSIAGELVLTNLGRLGSPVIRYRTGDLVEMIPASAQHPYSRLRGGVLARTDGMVVVRGVNVYPSAIENLVRSFADIDEFQVTVREVAEMRELEIEIEVAADRREAVAAQLQELIRDRLSLRSKIVPRDLGSLPRYELKARRFKLLRK